MYDSDCLKSHKLKVFTWTSQLLDLLRSSVDTPQKSSVWKRAQRTRSYFSENLEWKWGFNYWACIKCPIFPSETGKSWAAVHGADSFSPLRWLFSAAQLNICSGWQISGKEQHWKRKMKRDRAAVLHSHHAFYFIIKLMDLEDLLPCPLMSILSATSDTIITKYQEEAYHFLIYM